MRIIVTGVCGLIGKKIAAHLLGQGHEVYGIGRALSCDSLETGLLLNYIQLDLSSEDAVEKLKKMFPIDIDLVIHCAAQQPRSELSFKEYRKGNIDTTESIVEWAVSVNVRAIINFSTVAFLEFPLEDGIKLTESAKINPKNYYSLSKWASESYLSLLDNNTELTVLCFRIPSLVQEEQLGGVIHTYWDAALRNIDLDIYDNGRFRRNLIYIDSIIDIIDMSLMNFVSYTGFRLFNVGSKDAWTLMDIAKYMYKKMGATAKILPIDKSSSVTGHWNIDTSKAEKELGFVPWDTQKILDTYICNMRG